MYSGENRQKGLGEESASFIPRSIHKWDQHLISKLTLLEEILLMKVRPSLRRARPSRQGKGKPDMFRCYGFHNYIFARATHVFAYVNDRFVGLYKFVSPR